MILEECLAYPVTLDRLVKFTGYSFCQYLLLGKGSYLVQCYVLCFLFHCNHFKLPFPFPSSRPILSYHSDRLFN